MFRSEISAQSQPSGAQRRFGSTRYRFNATIALLGLASSVTDAAIKRADSLTDLHARIATAKPGDVIELKDGVYTTDAPIVVACAGTAAEPITIAAASVGGVEVRGNAGFTFSSSAAHIELRGFHFTHESGRTTIEAGASHVRIARNVFQCAGNGAYLTVSGDDCEVAYNEFRDKATVGNMISVTGADGQVARRLWIHHNHFHDFAPAGANGSETIRFGLSGLSLSRGDGLVEYNLFERCLGENELISNKSCNNTYRFNTLADSPGAQLTLRHGNECIVYGNILRGTGGLRFFGDRHQIFGNHFEGNSVAIQVGNGGAEVADGAPLTSHDRPDGCHVSFNTMIDNRTHLRMTPRTPTALGATQTAIRHNVIHGGGAAARIEGPNSGATWENNTIWAVEEPGDVPELGRAERDPALTPTAEGLRLPAAWIDRLIAAPIAASRQPVCDVTAVEPGPVAVRLVRPDEVGPLAPPPSVINLP
jgi:poly(beta-D-mannuronate) lyase